MKKSPAVFRSLAVVACVLAGAAAWCPTASAQSRRADTPRVYLLDARTLAETRRAILSGDTSFDAALRKLEAEARDALNVGPFTVTSKGVTPPSGDKHDYMSQAPYFWPDPSKPGGLPYVRRDGERNPEINKITDHREMDRMVAAVSTLALRYYLRGGELYAAKAAALLRAWFLDPATRMNPHLQFGQGIPGVNTGRGIGLIETRGLTRVVDAVGLLEGSKSLTAADRRGLRLWFAEFLRWMRESKFGRDEAAAKNNHGTYYDVQAASFSLFVGRREWAKDILKTARAKRVAAQIEPDGSQPLELERTRSWGYSVGNLDGLMQLAALGDNVGVDLWHYRTRDGRGIRAALDYLIPYALGERRWPHQQIGEWSTASLFPLMRRAASEYDDEKYRRVVAKLPPPDRADRSWLLSPRLSLTKVHFNTEGTEDSQSAQRRNRRFEISNLYWFSPRPL